jgi:preprotein translocase subunit SecE
MNKALAFLGDVKRELHKVQWPTRAQTVRYTLLVIVISLVVALYLGALDYLFSNIFKRFF